MMAVPVLPPQFREIPPPAYAAREQKVVGGLWASRKWPIAIVLALGLLTALGLGAMFYSGTSDSLRIDAQGTDPTVPAPTPTSSTSSQRPEQTVQDAWTINCRGSGAERKCSGVLQVVDKEKRQLLFSWILGRTADGTTSFMFQTPTGVQLQQGIEFQLGNAAPRKANYVMCNPQICVALLPMDARMIKEAIAALNDNATATVTTSEGRAINFTIPIKGIDKVFAAVRG